MRMVQNHTAFLASTMSPPILPQDSFSHNSSNSTMGTDMGTNVATATATLILGLGFLLGCPGNLFIIWSILARARKRSVTTLLILNLAFADGFLMALTPVFMVYLAKRSWIFGNIMCKVLFFLCCTNMYASIMLITMMSLYRLVAVRWPQLVKSVVCRRTIRRILPGMWVLVLLLSIPAYLFREERPKLPSGLACTPSHSSEKHWQVVFHYTFETALAFIVPYGVIVGSYICILRRIQQTKFKRRMRSEKLILTIVVTFGFFWLPYHIINIIQAMVELISLTPVQKQSLGNAIQSARTITSALAFISSCANPVLYTFWGKAYIRQAGVAFMARLFEGTALDTMSKKGQQVSLDSRSPREGEELQVEEKEADSTFSKTKMQDSTFPVLPQSYRCP